MTRPLIDALERVNKEITECPSENTDRLDKLIEMRNDLISSLAETIRNIAQQNNKLGLGDVATGMVVEGVCATTLFMPTP